jgi:mycothiol S-conjugate amidase
MRDAPFTILAVFAHPDDEIGVGSTLAYYSERGVLTVLACASRGEVATIYCDECATRENLADVRTHELECASRHLGVAQLRWLDWPDGGIAKLPRDKAIGTVVALIRELQPDVLITHPANGLYPHPDHIAIWEITRAAYDAAADVSQYPEAGLPWAPARLFTRGIPQSYFDAAPEFASYRVELNGQKLPFYPTPDEEIDVTMQVAAWAPRRLAAWECHRSQHNPQGAFSGMSDDLRRRMAEEEYFVLEASRAPLAEGVKGDLLAGLEDGVEPGAGGEEDAAVQALRGSMAVRRAYLAVYERYLGEEAKPPFRALLKALADHEREMIYLLAGVLRRADQAVSEISPNQRLITQALAFPDTWAQAQFLRVGAQHAAQLYRARADAAADGASGLWAELAAVAEAQLSAVSRFLSAEVTKQPAG